MKEIEIQKILKEMVNDKRVRLNIVKRSHKFFFYYYFAHYAEFEIAPFQEEMFSITQDASIRNAVIVGFRGCSKSSIFSMSFPLWAILGEQRLKNVALLSQTTEKTGMLLRNIKLELENNELLKNDLGPFKEERDGWNSTSLYLTKYNAKITIASTEQSIRSLRHMQYRPQLFVLDDCEDLNSVRTLEGRDKIFNWFFGDVVPAGDKKTRTFIVGSLLHEDSLIKRLQKSIFAGRMAGVYREYPLLDQNCNPTWPGKYPNQKSIEDEKMKGIPYDTWQREYLLKIIPNENQIIRPDWIRRYGQLPASGLRYAATGIDLAISEKETADYTAMVSANIYGSKDSLKIYILADPLNQRISFQETLDRSESLSLRIGNGLPSPLFVEEVGYQTSLIQQLKSAGFPAEGVKVRSQDKRSRLASVSHLVQNGQVIFPERGAEKMIEQLIGFGVERHDDMADAFAILLTRILERNNGFSFSFGDKVFDPGELAKLAGLNKQPNGQENNKPLDPNEEWKRLGRQADLDIMRRDLELGRN